MSKVTTPFIIGVAGGSGSGKTTIAERLAAMAKEQSVIISHDAYYRDQHQLSMTQRHAVNYDHPNSLDTELLVQHLQQLKARQSIERPTYDFVAHTRAALTQTIEPYPVIIVEGILLFSDPELRQLFDLKIFVDTEADVRFIRRLQRDVADRGRTPESVIEQYLSTVRPMHLEFVEPSKRFADVIIPEGGHNDQALELLAARVHRIATASKV